MCFSNHNSGGVTHSNDIALPLPSWMCCSDRVLTPRSPYDRVGLTPPGSRLVSSHAEIAPARQAHRPRWRGRRRSGWSADRGKFLTRGVSAVGVVIYTCNRDTDSRTRHIATHTHTHTHTHACAMHCRRSCRPGYSNRSMLTPPSDVVLDTGGTPPQSFQLQLGAATRVSS